MSKKQPRSKASPSTRSSTAKAASLKKIVREIDKALKSLEDRPKPRSAAGNQEVERARLALRAARSAVESACAPGFAPPDPE
jgi:hypothetical protein